MMTWKDYLDEVAADARKCIEEEYSYCRDWDEMSEFLFISDHVTGNGSGSYTFSRAQAAENVSGIVFDLDVFELFRSYGYDHVPVEEGPEVVDVIARCLALDEVSEALESIFDGLKSGRAWACTDCSTGTGGVSVPLDQLDDGTFYCPVCRRSYHRHPGDWGACQIDDGEAVARFAALDSLGAPSCGCEAHVFADETGPIDYLDANPDVSARLADGYARTVEL